MPWQRPSSCSGILIRYRDRCFPVSACVYVSTVVSARKITGMMLAGQQYVLWEDVTMAKEF